MHSVIMINVDSLLALQLYCVREKLKHKYKCICIVLTECQPEDIMDVASLALGKDIIEQDDLANILITIYNDIHVALHKTVDLLQGYHTDVTLHGIMGRRLILHVKTSSTFNRCKSGVIPNNVRTVFRYIPRLSSHSRKAIIHNRKSVGFIR